MIEDLAFIELAPTVLFLEGRVGIMQTDSTRDLIAHSYYLLRPLPCAKLVDACQLIAEL